MSGRPIHTIIGKRRVRGRQSMWTHIRSWSGPFTAADIADKTGDNLRTVISFLNLLLKGGYLHAPVGSRSIGRNSPLELRHDIGRFLPSLKADGSISRHGLKQANMWRAMKMLKGAFTVRDVMATASLPNAAVTYQEARSYVYDLAAAQYLHVVERGRPQHPSRYVFNQTRNTGPLAPMIQRRRAVFDQNEHRVVWIAKGKGDAS